MTSRLAGRRVACFYPWNPFEPTGSWTRFSSMWKFFLEQGAQVTLAFLDQGADVQLKNLSVRYLGDPNLVSNIGQLAQKIVAAEARSELRGSSPAELTFLSMYEKALYLANAKLATWLDRVVAEHDVVTCEYPMFAPLLSEFCAKAKKPLIVTSHDAIFELHGTTAAGKERLKAKEVEAMRLANAVVYCNESERDLFAGENVPGIVVPNTGDAFSVLPGREDEARESVRAQLKIKTPHYVLFIGSAHGPNMEAAAEVRRIAKAVPEVTFIVGGKCYPRTTENNFLALHYLADSALDLLHRGALAVIVPLMRGTGMSVKTYQAFAYGKPVISTPLGARGYKVTDGNELLLVPSPTEIPAAIRRLLKEPALRQSLGKRAREYAEELDFRKQFEPYAKIVEELSPAPAQPGEPNIANLVLVDNNLADRVGHHYNYALSLREELHRAGLGFTALIKASAGREIAAELSAVPVFARGIHDDAEQNPYPPDWGPLRATYDFLSSNHRFAQELEAGLQGRVGTSDVVFLPNATPRQILGVALLLKKHAVYHHLRFVLLLRYSVNVAFGPIAARKTTLDKETADQYALAIDKLQLVDTSGAVRLTTDSEELAKEYSAFSKRPIEVLPIPHTAHGESGAMPDGVPAKAGKLRVVYMGDARDEKGFELLPAVAKAFSKEPWSSRVEFVFQAFISSPYHNQMGLAIEELARMKSPNLSLVRSSLTAEAYQALLASADVVLLPYDALTYRARTSGPFVEAICANKPVIVPKPSWMSIQLANSGAGETFVSGNTPDLVRAVGAVLQNLDHYAEAAAQLGERFRTYHNPTNFVRKLMQL